MIRVICVVDDGVNDADDDGGDIYNNVSNDEDGEKLPPSKKWLLKKLNWLGLAREKIINFQSPASTYFKKYF